jgi:hypothetical protein
MGVNVRVIRQPFGFVNGISLRRYHPGQIYEMNPALAEYLVLEGFALFEMRREQRSSRVRPNERRKGGYA